MTYNIKRQAQKATVGRGELSQEKIQKINSTQCKLEKLICAINDATVLMLSSGDEEFEKTLSGCMQIMADCVNADRIFIWRNSEISDKTHYIQVFEWVNELGRATDSVRASKSYSYSQSIPEWEQKLKGGICVNGPLKSLSQKEQERLTPFGIKSILVVPVYWQREFWGFVSFDDCKDERYFSKQEESILRSGSLMLASAFMRNDMSKSIKSAVKKMEEAVEKARTASQAKSNFLSNMSHEIRTPLNAIIGMTLIGKTAADIEKKDYAFSKIDEASSHLLGVINDILDMTKIEANKFELCQDSFSFERMIQRVTTVIGFKLEEKNQRFSCEISKSIPKTLIGDDQRLAQVIANLLSNAVKFTPEYGSIRLDASLISQSADECIIKISVKDTGIGVSLSEQERIFKSFEQAERSTTRKYGGTGLGLAISKHIVECMGGELSLESEPGKGSTFSFTVRLAKSEYETEEEGAAQIGKATDKELIRLEGRRILLAEDVQINREIILSLFEPTGLIIDCATNGKEAVDMMSDPTNEYELVFMDIQMPGMDGLEATRRIRAIGSPYAKNIPIIAMTANVFKDDVKKCVKSGMNGHIGKPIDYDAILGIIRKYLIES